MKVELIYDRDCPNVVEARLQLSRALADCGLSTTWTEWDRGDEQSPPHVRHYGSPTILVNGTDVAGAAPSDGADCCRLYQVADGYRGAPSVDMIASALRDTCCKRDRSSRLRGSLALIPAIVIASVPNLACPACWPAHAGVLASLGLGFLLHEAYLLPLTVTFLLLAAIPLAISCRRRRGVGPFALGIMASATVLVGKFAMKADLVMFIGIALLIAASIWNVWPARPLQSIDRQSRQSDDSTCSTY